MTGPSSEDQNKADDADRPEVSREQCLAQAVAEFLDLQAREESVDIEEFCRRHPDLEPELKIELRTVVELDENLAPSAVEAFVRAQEEPPPERLSGYKILGIIGAGGMGRVLLALDEGPQYGSLLEQLRDILAGRQERIGRKGEGVQKLQAVLCRAEAKPRSASGLPGCEALEC